MKLFIILIAVMLVLLSCNDDVNVTLKKEPGTLYGRVLPLNINAQLELYQGGLIKTTTTDNDGYFGFSSLNPGNYILKARADNYGRVETLVKIEDGEGFDIGTIELINLPFPLTDIQPNDGATDVSNPLNHARIYIYFSKNIDVNVFEQAFSITPVVEDLTITGPSGRTSSTYFRIEGKFLFNQQYTFELDTTLMTTSGEKLEFPVISTFTTEKFKVQSFSNYQSLDQGYFPVRIGLNGEINASSLEQVVVEPDIPVNLHQTNYNSIEILPVLTWPCDTTVSITLPGTLSDLTGSTLGTDTTLTFDMPELKVAYTDPYNGQRFINTYDDIHIRFNNVIDESTIENALNISPSINYSLDTYMYSNSGQTRLYIYPDSLQSNMEYTVTIDTTLKGYYLGNLKEDYIFKFHTK